MKQTSSTMVQAIGFFIAADALLLGYGLTQQKAVFLLFAAFNVVGIFVVFWRTTQLIVVISYVAFHLERRLLGRDEVALISFLTRIKSRSVFNHLEIADDAGDPERRDKEISLALSLHNVLKSRTFLAIVAMFVIQIILFVVAMTGFNYRFM